MTLIYWKKIKTVHLETYIQWKYPLKMKAWWYFQTKKKGGGVFGHKQTCTIRTLKEVLLGWKMIQYGNLNLHKGMNSARNIRMQDFIAGKNARLWDTLLGTQCPVTLCQSTLSYLSPRVASSLCAPKLCYRFWGLSSLYPHQKDFSSFAKMSVITK